MMFLSHRSFSLNAKVSKFLLKTVKLSLWFGATAYIIYKLLGYTGEYYGSLTNSLIAEKTVFFSLIFVCLLSIVNWSLEAFKWHLLAGKIQKISFTRSFKGVLIGIAMGMVTIKRLGEFAGKAIVLDKGNRVDGAIINTAGTLCQLLVTLVAGLISIVVLIIFDNVNFNSFFSFHNLQLLMAGLSILATFFFIVRKRLFRFFSKFKWFSDGHKKFLILKTVNRPEFLRLLLFSFLRYAVFMLQCFLLYKLTGLKISLPEAFLFQSIVFLFMTVMPVTTFSELAVKGGIAILVFSHIFAASIANYSGYEISLVLANGLLWLINLAIPALVGAMLSFNLVKK